MWKQLVDEALYATKRRNKQAEPRQVVEPNAVPRTVVEPKTVPSKVVEPKTVPSKVVEPKTVPSKVVEPKAVPKQFTDKDGLGRAHGAENDINHRQHSVHIRDEGRKSERLV